MLVEGGVTRPYRDRAGGPAKLHGGGNGGLCAISHASRAECKVFMFWIVDQGAMAGKDSQGLSALMLGVDSGQGEVSSGKGC